MIEGKDAIDIVSVIGAEIQLHQCGSRFKASCPFHEEKTPSFMVVPDSQKFHCFGCGAHGDVVDFIQMRHGLSFQDALKHLGLRPGAIDDARKRQIDRKKKAFSEYERWERDYCNQIGKLIRDSYDALAELTKEDFNLYGSFLHGLFVWEYHLWLMVHGDKEDKFNLYQELRRGRIRSESRA